MEVKAGAAVEGEVRSATSISEETARLSQSLEDLNACLGASVSLVRCPSASRERALVKALGSAARTRGFATATVSLREHALDTPESLVREVLDKLTPPSEARSRGLLWCLERFYDVHGTGSAREFDSCAGVVDADGDLTALCRAYLSTDDVEAIPQVRAYEAWRDGVKPARKYRNPAVRRALTEQTAQRALGELTRIMLALGYRGTVVFLCEGDALAKRTERQREKAYTVLRELVDNFDGGSGAIATRVMLTGQDALFEGDHSIRSIEPLDMRLQVPGDAQPAPPHRSSTTVSKPTSESFRRKISAWDKRPKNLENLIRISEGVPPTRGVTSMSVGQERLDRTISRLFELVKRSGGFFSALVGDYGSGKTHLMMHLAERALEDNRPVFWLNLERTNLDLGNPARHLSRLLSHSQMPLRARPSALDLLHKWTRSNASVKRLMLIIDQLSEGDGEAASAARKAQRICGGAKDPGAALENYLSGADLCERSGDPTYRRDAYRRLFLWLELLERLEEIRGPVVLIDEAENLYTSGRPPASRRTALRSLGFYCGGALPATCVILAITPPAFDELKGEARALLSDAAERESTLDLENVERFRKALWGLRPDPVKPLKRSERVELCERVRRMHRSVRGAVSFDDWAEFTGVQVAAHRSPRTLIRSVVDELESRWWAG